MKLTEMCIKCGEKNFSNLIPIEEGLFNMCYMCQPCANRAAGVFFEDQGSWFKVDFYEERELFHPVLMVAPAYNDGTVDADAWGPVEEHGFDCMGIRGEHDHDSEGVRWIAEINKAFNTEFTLEEFE